MEPETTQAPIAQFHEHPSVCLGVSGSIAVVKTLEIVSGLLDHGVSVDVVVTESAYKLMQATYHGAQPWGRLLSLAAASQEHAAATTTRAATHASLPAASISATGGGVLADHAATLRIFRDIDEWSEYGAVGSDSVLHIEIAKRNQVLLLAPLCANMLAHAALGLCSNLLGSVLRAWYYDLEEEFAAPLAGDVAPAADLDASRDSEIARCIDHPASKEDARLWRCGNGGNGTGGCNRRNDTLSAAGVQRRLAAGSRGRQATFHRFLSTRTRRSGSAPALRSSLALAHVLPECGVHGPTRTMCASRGSSACCGVNMITNRRVGVVWGGVLAVKLPEYSRV